MIPRNNSENGVWTGGDRAEGRLSSHEVSQKHSTEIPQAPANWHGAIDDFVISVGIRPLEYDPYICIYLSVRARERNGQLRNREMDPMFANWNKGTVMLTIYAGCRLFAGEAQQGAAQEAGENADGALLRHRAHGGRLVGILGCKALVTRRKGRSPSISQEHHTILVLDRCGMGECHRRTRPESDRCSRSKRGEGIFWPKQPRGGTNPS